MITVNKFIWEFTGQAAHITVSAFLMLLLGVHFGRTGQYWGLGIGIPAAAIKEFWYDYKYEDKATRGSSLLDFGMYLAGMGLGWISL